MASAAAALKGILNETIGPMAALTAGALAFVKYTAGAALNAEKMAAALRASADGKRLESQFKLIMGSAGQARKKVAELSREAARSPFSFQALGKAALNLQALSNGAFASSRALKQVQDIAVATGTPVDAVAAAMGDLVGSLNRGGEGAGQAAAQLASMGAISQDTAQKVAALAQSGAPAGEAMRLVEAETKKASGASAELANTIDGLQQQLENLQTASDAKIGAMFEEGEKAGRRAAIGFQKFNNAVQEAASGPWSTITGGFNAIKEAIGGFLGRVAEMGAVRAIMQALGSVSVAVFGLLAASLLQGAGALIGFAVKARLAQAAMTGLITTGRSWASLMTGVSGGLTIIGTGLALLAMKAADARQQIASMTDELKRSGNEAGTARGTLVEQAGKIQTPEDQTAAKDAAKVAVEDAKKNLETAKAQAAAAKKARDEYYGIRPDGSRRIAPPDFSFGIEGAKREAAVTISDVAVKQAQDAYNQMLEISKSINGINAATLALDQKRTEEARERAKLEKQISEDARQAAAQMGAGSMAAAQTLKAESAQRKKDAELASSQVDKGKQSIAQVTGQAAPEMEAALGGRATALEGKFNALRDIEKNAPTNDFGVTALNAQIAQRQMLMDEFAAAQGVIAKGTAATPQETAGAIAVQQTVRKLLDQIGGAAEITGAKIGSLTSQRDAGMENIDQGAAIRADAQNAQMVQAQAVSDAEVQASVERLRNETLISQLKKTSAQVAEQELQAQLKAAQELRAAQEARANVKTDATKEEAAKRQLLEARAAAEQVGVTTQTPEEIIRTMSDAQMQGTLSPQVQQALEAQLKAAIALRDAEQALSAQTEPREAAQKRLNEAQVNAARVGVTTQSPEELAAQIQSGMAQRQKSIADMTKRAQLDALRMQEKYGSDPVSARKQANALEDQIKKDQRAVELGNTISDSSMAKRIASLQVDMERAASNIEDMGTPQMSEMASVGGSAGFAGLVNNPMEEMKRLNETSKAMKEALDKVNKQMEEQMRIANQAIAASQQ